jgi:hypothetical protein
VNTGRPKLSEQLIRRVCGEYLEMPGMRLSRTQAQRLWGLDEETCTQILEFLVEARFLRLSARDTYGRLTEGPVAFPRSRTTEAPATHADHEQS